MKTIAVIAGLIALFGIAGTPDYVLDVELENERLRAEIKRTTLNQQRVKLAASDCRDADLIAAHHMLARGE